MPAPNSFPVGHLPLEHKPLAISLKAALIAAALVVAAVLVWQGATAAGAPDPTQASSKPGTILDIGVLVFREGLECILVLAAITASLTGEKRSLRRPVVAGAGLGFLATIVTWFIAVGILADLSGSIPALALQAASGLLAVVVLAIVMNWFFHNVYWGGWMTLHNRRKRELVGEVGLAGGTLTPRLWWGMALLGFASLYREGFEVVLFLQSYYLKMGGVTVLTGACIGLALSGAVAVLTFVFEQRLPYRKMLVLTGVLLGAVLLVMVGEEAQEMQLAHWLPTTTIKALDVIIPAWAGVWFSIFPTVETLASQALAAIVVAGSYFACRKLARR